MYVEQRLDTRRVSIDEDKLEQFVQSVVLITGIAYTALNANENKELVAQYGVKQAPTLVLIEGDGFTSFRGVSDIKGWLMTH